ncbi:carbonic anhydrase family protein [Salinimicrobium flavum]|uniref:Carbonic anhydrase family protein n=1 Tax=Salinimicrobium flavum TaxID=1737065 RepID=A0ABW5J0U2_9FLAO
MKNLNYWSLILVISFLMGACGEAEERNETNERVEEREMAQQTDQRDADISLTEERRNALTPDDVVKEFQQGNQNFIKDSLTPRNRQRRIQETGSAQYPKGMILSCIDSRVPVEEIFDQGLGDIFVGRIAGNFADEEMLGSMEFATKVAGSKVIVVLGHENCGAVKSAIDEVELGNITAMLKHIKPAVKMTDNYPEEQRSIKNVEYVNEVVKNNVIYTVDEIRKNSSIIAEMEENGEIKILGAVYDVNTGTVEFL